MVFAQQKMRGSLRQSILNRYHGEDSKSKILAFAKTFLKYLSQLKLDGRYHAFEIFLEKPRPLKERKRVTSRIITSEDIENVLTYIKSQN